LASREELETLNPTVLAVLCGKVADVSDAATSEHARALKVEWASLQTPPSSSLTEERKKDAKRQDVRKRMLDFLEGRNDVDWMPKR
jgi:hypothetical protein